MGLAPSKAGKIRQTGDEMRSYIQTSKAPQAIGAYSQAVKVNDTVYVSGQIPLDPQTQKMVSDNFREQAVQVFKNIKAIIEESGGELGDIVKVNASLTDLSNFAALNEVMEEFFEKPFPARAAVQVAALPKASLLEVEVIAVID